MRRRTKSTWSSTPGTKTRKKNNWWVIGGVVVLVIVANILFAYKNHYGGWTELAKHLPSDQQVQQGFTTFFTWLKYIGIGIVGLVAIYLSMGLINEVEWRFGRGWAWVTGIVLVAIAGGIIYLAFAPSDFASTVKATNMLPSQDTLLSIGKAILIIAIIVIAIIALVFGIRYAIRRPSRSSTSTLPVSPSTAPTDNGGKVLNLFTFIAATFLVTLVAIHIFKDLPFFLNFIKWSFALTVLLIGLAPLLAIAIIIHLASIPAKLGSALTDGHHLGQSRLAELIENTVLATWPFIPGAVKALEGALFKKPAKKEGKNKKNKKEGD